MSGEPPGAAGRPAKGGLVAAVTSSNARLRAGLKPAAAIRAPVLPPPWSQEYRLLACEKW